MTERGSVRRERPVQPASAAQSLSAAGPSTSASRQQQHPPASATATDTSSLGGARANSANAQAVLPELAAACSELVKKYRSGEVDKVDTIIGIQALLNQHAAGEEGQNEAIKQALKSYIGMLDNHDALRSSALEHATHTFGAPGASDAGSDDGDRGGLPGGDIPATAGNLAGSKRAKSPTTDGEDDTPSPKRRIDPGCFPWVVREALEPTPLAPELRQTQRLLENFSRDLKFAKSSLLNSPSLPQFPDTEWANLLAGKCVNLDHVYTAIYSATPDDRRREKLGSVEIVVGGSGAPAKNVESEAAWTTSWDISNHFVEAALYIFPHRDAELRIYGKFVKQLFTSLAPNRHLRVIAYDKACRIRASQRRDILLSDSSQFVDLQLLWLNDSGGGSAREIARTAKSSNPGSKSRRAVCRRFNAGRCPNDAASCAYAHVCNKCNGNGHVESACTK
ncbi:hypothetical protein HYPSUDRAFT_140788 [Hypholoma sublateritium FD-334 SS-4]|uniref:C3H1-type domain-containing protein n=1 Tax=Hypholoma sublateritium (strain FD-334 SS-4) TaxID=945553 RepID=A0A0D2NRG0_HYPSF|nr:hypothetical protein HYPSUDRAFT_140788 [Hypholoma sublateritium FD-334 SS-4]